MKLNEFKNIDVITEAPDNEVLRDRFTALATNESFFGFGKSKEELEADKRALEMKRKAAEAAKLAAAKKLADTAAAARAAKDKLWAAAKKKIETPPGAPKKYDKVPSANLGATRAKAAEKDWVGAFGK